MVFILSDSTKKTEFSYFFLKHWFSYVFALKQFYPYRKYKIRISNKHQSTYLLRLYYTLCYCSWSSSIIISKHYYYSWKALEYKRRTFDINFYYVYNNWVKQTEKILYMFSTGYIFWEHQFYPSFINI